MDSAKPVPSPGTLSSFASQQESTRSSTDQGDRHSADENAASAYNTANAPASSNDRTATPTAATGTDAASFDFQKFLDQMKSRSAEPVAKYLRSFLSNFAKRTFTIGDQVKIINDFLNFISIRMREVDAWKTASDVEFDYAMEGMEKLVMNRLYEFTFTPQVARAVPPRPITSDDLEKDRILSQRIGLFGWIEEKHLDIPVGEGSKGFLMFAQQGHIFLWRASRGNSLFLLELLKMNHYKAPRDKLICILNCCKVIFGLIRHLRKEEGADSFVPILIFVVLKANPDHLISNVEFINRFRNPAKLQSEAGYYLSSLMGAVSFIETMDHTSLSNITQEEFEQNVEEAILSLPPSHPHSPTMTPSSASIPSSTPKFLGPQSPHNRSHSHPSSPSLPTSEPSPHAGEESAQPLSLPTPTIPALPGQTILSDDARRLLQKTGDTISKPLNAIGRIFSEALDGAESKLTYLPGPFAPFELGRERDGQTPQSHWSHPDQIAQHSQGPSRQFPQTPMNNADPNMAPIQTPYKPRVRKTPSPYHSTSNSPDRSPRLGYASSPEETPTRYGNSGNAPYTNSPLALGPSQAILPPRVQSLAQPEFGISLGPNSEGAHLSRTPTPALDLSAVQEQIDNAHEQAAAASKSTLVQIFPTVDTEVVQWVLEANDGDLDEDMLPVSKSAFPTFPAFPDDVPTHPLVIVDYELIKGGDKDEIERLWKAATELGFWYLKNHGVEHEANDMFDMGRETMDLPLEEKMKYEQGDGGSSFGYKARGQVATDAMGTRDNIEFINVAKDDALAWPKQARRNYPPTVNARMHSTVIPFIRKSMEVNATLLDVFNEKLGLPEGALARRHSVEEFSGSEARCTKSPPTPIETRLGIGAHTDFGSLSFLHNRLGGLQVLPPNSETWQYIKPIPGYAICNLGDAMAIFSGGILRSNIHRVCPPPGAQKHLERWSLVYFTRPGDSDLKLIHVRDPRPGWQAEGRRYEFEKQLLGLSVSLQACL
ncbi:hypothetical protein EYR38_008636 [Pleurotus pulmonarius]|nr:hypothetical protein EYR38_008636 [Pleurotus pulmonarius]